MMMKTIEDKKKKEVESSVFPSELVQEKTVLTNE